MSWVLEIINLYLLATVMLTIFCAMYSFAKRRSVIHILFAILCICIMLYSFGYMMEINFTSTKQMLFWNEFQYLGIPFFPAVWVLFILYLTNHRLRKALWFELGLFVIPVATLVLRLTNQYHFLYYTKIQVANFTGYSVLALGKGPWYFVHTAFVMLCIAFGAILLLGYSRKKSKKERLSYYMIVLISATPLFGVIINLFNIWEIYLDFAAFTIPLMSVFLFTLIFNNDLLKLKSYARDKIFENSQSGILMLSSDFRILDFNHAARNLFPSLTMEYIEKPVSDFFGEKSKLSKAIRSKSNYQLDVNIHGTPLYYYTVTAEIFSKTGKLIGHSVTFSDITNIVKINDRITHLAIELDKEKDLLKATLLSVGGGVISTDRDANIILINPMAETLTGWTQEEAYGYPVSQVLQLLYNGNVQHPVDPVRQVLETGSRIEMDENIYLYTKDSKQIPVENTVAPIHSTDGTITGAVIVFQDYTDKKKKNEMVQFLSYHDQLTGIYNRRYFEEKFEEFEKEQYMPVSMIMADINGLKLANDAFGHELGDQLLILSANMIAKYCRQEDIFSRVGGDEFIILMPNTDETQAHQIVQRIREEIRDKMVGELEVSISFGWDTKNQSGKPLRDIYKRAEDFMYQHKLNESPAMREKTIHRIIESLFTQIPSEREHSSHVGAYCEIMGHALHLSEMQVNDMRMAGNLHDIGKIAIDYGVLNHAGPLSETDWIETKRHAELGYRILEEVNDLVPVAEIVLAHHENWDGTGYPKGLSGNQIPLQSRIIRIADSYDAMICDRVYRKSIGSQAAKAELQKNAGVMFDPEMVLLFIRNIIP